MEQKPWLKSYPEGVPPEIDPARYGSLTQLLEESFRKHAGLYAVAIVAMLVMAGMTAASAWIVVRTTLLSIDWAVRLDPAV